MPNSPPENATPATLKQVEALRRCRGKLTLKQMQEVLGLKGISGLLSTARLCKRFEIARADDDPENRPSMLTADRAVDLADRERHRQIMLARTEMADPRAKPFKVGKLGDE